jgi:hypothetical protein
VAAGPDDLRRLEHLAMLLGRAPSEGERVRYYVYASDAKIDMLFSQIPAKLLSRIVGELKLDLKVLSVSVRQRESEETLYGKLRVVETFVERELDVGSVAQSASWFRGEMPMRSGVWGGQPDGLAYFSGLQDGVLLALIGSAHHLLGQRSDPSAIRVSYSGLPVLVSMMAREEPDAPSAQRRDEIAQMPDDDHVIQEVFDFADALTGVRQPSEFLARRLLHGPVADPSGQVESVLLATPLYVALTED